MIKGFFSRIPSSLAKVFFGARPFWFAVFILLTVFLGWHASQLELRAQFSKMLPVTHPFVQNYLEYRDELGSSNAIRVVVENENGDIYSKEFMKTLQKIDQAVFFIKGVNRPMMKSLWRPTVRFMTVTAKGFSGGPVIPARYDGDEQSLAQLRENIANANIMGSLVGFDQRSTAIYAPLFAMNPETGEPLNYSRIKSELEDIRQKYGGDGVSIHIIGDAVLLGTLIQAAGQVMWFFAIAVLITLAVLLVYARCLRSAIAPIFCSLIGVVWQLGILNLLGVPLNPYSMLVPFLKFAIGVSHGTQMINNIGYRIAHGRTRYEASRETFKVLLRPGLTAMACSSLGFLTLFIIQVPAIQELAVAAGVGVVAVVLANLVLLPMLMSYVGVSKRRRDQLATDDERRHPVLSALQHCTEPRFAVSIVVVVAVAFAVGLYVRKDLKVGDVGTGAAELWYDSQYNQDVRYISSHYGASSDVFEVMVVTDKRQCLKYHTLSAIDRYTWWMSDVDNVRSIKSLSGIAKKGWVGLNEGSFKWYGLPKNQNALGSTLGRGLPAGMVTANCSMTPVSLFLGDHRAETLNGVVEATREFKQNVDTDDVQFLMAGGSAGVQAATNLVIEEAQYKMMFTVYAVVTIFCLLAFRSWRATVSILIPLMLTSVIAEAVMAWMGLGVKVSTMPVIALGVGIGVDYGIYIYARLRDYLNEGMSVGDAYYEALKTAGRAVALTGLTLGISIVTWAFSPIKFQADMGLLLTFMFVWNMLGALIVTPAIASLLVKSGKNGNANA